MCSVKRFLFVLPVCLFAVTSPVGAKTVTLTGQGLTIVYEDRAAGVFGAPSLISTALMPSPVSFAATASAPATYREGAEVTGAAGVQPLAAEERARSFADGVEMRFSLDEIEARDPGLTSLLLAGFGLFGLIARQRLHALRRGAHSPGLQ